MMKFLLALLLFSSLAHAEPTFTRSEKLSSCPKDIETPESCLIRSCSESIDFSCQKREKDINPKLSCHGLPSLDAGCSLSYCIKGKWEKVCESKMSKKVLSCFFPAPIVKNCQPIDCKKKSWSYNCKKRIL